MMKKDHSCCSHEHEHAHHPSAKEPEPSTPMAEVDCCGEPRKADCCATPAIAMTRQSHDCCGGATPTAPDHPAERSPHSCCGHDGPPVQPASTAKYFCPMCPGVESAAPGDCPKCGMPLERNPAWRAAVVYRCPMHPEVESPTPGTCPKCGMALERVATDTSEDDSEVRSLTWRLWIGASTLR